MTESDGDRYAMRIFTPDAELPFAGHPTLGTAFVLVSEGRVSSPGTQSTAAGEVPIEVDLATNFAWMTQLPVEFGRVFEDRGLIARAIGLEPDDLGSDLPGAAVSTGLLWTIVPVRDAERLSRAQRDGRALEQAVAASGDEGLYLFAVTDEAPRRACSTQVTGSGRTRRRARRPARSGPTWPNTAWRACPARSWSARASAWAGRASCTSRFETREAAGASPWVAACTWSVRGRSVSRPCLDESEAPS